MARNGTGTYSVVNTFQSGDTITASSHNGNWTDVGAEMTNSVAADGQTSMTGPLKASNGTAALPSHTFASDTDTGRYHKAANTMADVVGGVEVLEISSTGVKISGVQADAFPSGTLMLFRQTAAPTGWTKQVGNNDVTLRVVSGAVSSGGTAAFSSVFTARSILQANLPNYTLPNTLGVAIADPGHPHQFSISGSAGGNFIAAPGSTAAGTGTTSTATTGITGSITGAITSGGSGASMDFNVGYLDVIVAQKN